MLFDILTGQTYFSGRYYNHYSRKKKDLLKGKIAIMHTRLSVKSAIQPAVFFSHKKISQQYFQPVRSVQANRLRRLSTSISGMGMGTSTTSNLYYWINTMRRQAVLIS
jgi:hypothetical protein